MTFDEVLREPSDKEKILDFCEELYKEHPYKVQGEADTYSQYNEAWKDCLDRVTSFIESL